MNDEMALDNSVRSARSRRRIGRLLRSSGVAWSLSILLHVGLFVVFYKMSFGITASKRQLIIPEARLVGGPVNPGPMGAIMDRPVRLSSDLPPRRDPAVEQTPKLNELPILSVPMLTPQTSGSVVSAPSRLALPGVADGGLGGEHRSTGGGGVASIGPASHFFGQAGNAYKVVYVADLSASLLLMYANDLAEEMRSSIRDLVPTQEFHIVFAMPGETRELQPQRLVPAIGSYKNMAYDFIKQSTAVPQKGKVDPGEAMRRAFAVKPQLIYFLTDGGYFELMPSKGTEYSELELLLKKLNPNGDVKITVIGYGLSTERATRNGEPLAQPPQVPFLERIAREHGGHFRIVEAR